MVMGGTVALFSAVGSSFHLQAFWGGGGGGGGSRGFESCIGHTISS